MRLLSLVLIGSALIFIASVGSPAHACVSVAPIELADIKYADVVVMGRVSNYTIVGSPNNMGSYAKFDVQIDEVLVGKSLALTATWENSTFAMPESMPPGPYLIALRDPKSAALPLRAPSTTILPNPEPTVLTVLQAPCAPPFIFESDSDEARELRRVLKP